MNDSKAKNNLSTDSQHPKLGYCLRCGGVLHVSEMSQCPRCQFQFNPDNPQTYATNREKFQCLEWWLPGFCLSVVVGVVSYAILVFLGEMSEALFIAVPLAIGAMLGFTVRLGSSLFAVIAMGFVMIAAILSVVLVIVMTNLAGIFCGVTLSIIFLAPVSVGVLLGILIRKCLKNTRYAQWQNLPILLIAVFPFGVQAVDNFFPHPIDIATVRTEIVLPTSASEAWKSLMFYEEVNHEPPWLLKLALPRPVRAEGSMGQVGETRRCIYENGHLTKQFTERVERRRLAFKVIEQHLHFERDVTLLDGSFQLQTLNLKQTRMTLSTRYIRHLRPAWLWEPIESKVVHTLHQHVLEGVRRKANRPEKSPPQNLSPPEYKIPSDSENSELWLALTNEFD